MTFQSVKVYLLEISTPLLVLSNKTEKARPSVYSLISDQQRAVCKDMVSPRLGTWKDPICQFMHYCISPPPPQSLWHHTGPPSYSSKMSSGYCLLASKQTKLALGAEQVAAACTCAKKPSGSPVMSCIYFLFNFTSLENVIIKKLLDGECVMEPVYSGGKCDFS